MLAEIIAFTAPLVIIGIFVFGVWLVKRMLNE